MTGEKGREVRWYACLKHPNIYSSSSYGICGRSIGRTWRKCTRCGEINPRQVKDEPEGDRRRREARGAPLDRFWTYHAEHVGGRECEGRIVTESDQCKNALDLVDPIWRQSEN